MLYIGNKLHQFFTERFKAYLIQFGSARIQPGMLMDVHYWWQDWLGGPSFRGEDGYAWEFLGVSGDGFPSELVEANYIQEQIDTEFSLKPNVEIPNYGLSVSGDAKQAYKVSVSLLELKQKSFVNHTVAPILLNKLLQLKRTNPVFWDRVNDDMLVTECFYATQFRAEFHSSGSVSAKAAVDKADLKIASNLEVTWRNDNVAEIKGLPGVPLAVRGDKV